MKESSGRLGVSVTEQGVCIRIAGRATCAISVDFQHLLEDCAEQGSRRFILDLDQCLTMDSTFLGTLAAFNERLAEQPASNPPAAILLYHPTDRIRTLLDNLGIAERFPLADTGDWQQGKFEEIQCGQGVPDKTELIRASLKAHQTLMAVNPDNVPKFKDVVSMLEDDLKNNQGES
ncbi:MAG: STAS domain-containing protein [Verrucomicrobiota bacterium]